MHKRSVKRMVVLYYEEAAHMTPFCPYMLTELFTDLTRLSNACLFMTYFIDIKTAVCRTLVNINATHSKSDTCTSRKPAANRTSLVNLLMIFNTFLVMPIPLHYASCKPLDFFRETRRVS